LREEIYGSGLQALRGLRDATTEICDVTALDGEDEVRQLAAWRSDAPPADRETALWPWNFDQD
jgi:hypothetical protein